MRQAHGLSSAGNASVLRRAPNTSQSARSRRAIVRSKIALLAAEAAAKQRFGDGNVHRISLAFEGSEPQGSAKHLGMPGPSAYIGTVWTQRGGPQTFGILEPLTALFRLDRVYWLSGKPDAMRVALGIAQWSRASRQVGMRNWTDRSATARRLVEIEQELALAQLPYQVLADARRLVMSAVKAGLRGNKGELKPDLVSLDRSGARLTVIGDRNSVKLNALQATIGIRYPATPRHI